MEIVTPHDPEARHMNIIYLVQHAEKKHEAGGPGLTELGARSGSQDG
jgi:hypothetical protein